MPELPEVETIRGQLAPQLEGLELSELTVFDERWSAPLPGAGLADAVDGRRLEQLGRRGKYLIFGFSDEVSLLVHLRMTGTLLLDPGERTRFARAHFAFAGGRDLYFDDPRRFGTAQLALGDAQRDEFLAVRLGPEPFDAEFDPERLYERTRASRAPIKAFLLDQRKIAGVGNIYADEALFRARIHPLRPSHQLTRKQVLALHGAVIESLREGIAAKGASIDDFRHPDGVRGTFQDRFLVHRREGEACVRCGCAIRKLRAAGRGTYVCERCQPRPRKVVGAPRGIRRRDVIRIATSGRD